MTNKSPYDLSQYVKTLGPHLVKRLERARRIAPPHPTDALYKWLEQNFRIRCALTRDERRGLRKIADSADFNIREKKPEMRMIVELTSGKHVQTKAKCKYSARLNEARSKKTRPKRLRRFIEGQGGINKVTW